MLWVIPLQGKDDGSKNGGRLRSSGGLGAKGYLPFDHQVPQGSLGLVVVEWDTRMVEKGEVFLPVSAKSFFEFDERCGVSGVAFCGLVEYPLELLLQVWRYLVLDSFLDSAVQLRELLIGLHNLFLLPSVKLSALCKVSPFPLFLPSEKTVSLFSVPVATQAYAPLSIVFFCTFQPVSS